MENLLRKISSGVSLEGENWWFSFYRRENASCKLRFRTSLCVVLILVWRRQDQQSPPPPEFIILCFCFCFCFCCFSSFFSSHWGPDATHPSASLHSVRFGRFRIMQRQYQQPHSKLYAMFAEGPSPQGHPLALSHCTGLCNLLVTITAGQNTSWRLLSFEMSRRLFR